MGGSGGGAAVLPGGPDHHERPPGERDARARGKNAVAGAGGAAVLPGAPDHHERAPGRDNNGACPLEDLPYAWPSDYTRVCVKVDTRTMTVYGDDSYPYPQAG